jgi:hypothetical protein
LAVPVIQLVPTDPSLTSNPDYNSMTEYLISGTYYIIDNAALVVYEFAQNIPGNAIVNTGASYSQFQAFLVANPPITQTNTASYPVVVAPQQEYIYLLRGMFTALVQMATSGNQSVPTDFYPLPSVL